ncbi:unnamed protein product [Hymenolepis diminuta]|uniref:Uncharacterized protein n=1 Tax=Hymenolepis diminuta TaxID=6216 RepID=A0A564XUW2_HYMDI|nr:unnamed protein product [Hymenolepis diminuta]
MINAKWSPVGVATEDEIFFYSYRINSDIADCFPKEVYEAELGRWSLLPPMIEERSWCAAVNIPDTGVLFIGGIGKNGSPLCSTELLMRRSAEVEVGGGEKWHWIPYIPMNKGHDGVPLAVYFQRRVHVVGCYDNIKRWKCWTLKQTVSGPT